jgi:hypothetical protein
MQHTNGIYCSTEIVILSQKTGSDLAKHLLSSCFAVSDIFAVVCYVGFELRTDVLSSFVVVILFRAQALLIYLLEFKKELYVVKNQKCR